MSSAEVLARHLEALTVGVEEVMKDYTESSIFFSPDGLLRGRAAIRLYFEQLLSSFPPALAQALTLVRQDIDGDVAYIVWKAEPFIPMGTDTFVIRDGKIVVQTFLPFVVPAA
jgi:hypothetical protein